MNISIDKALLPLYIVCRLFGVVHFSINNKVHIEWKFSYFDFSWLLFYVVFLICLTYSHFLYFITIFELKFKTIDDLTRFTAQFLPILVWSSVSIPILYQRQKCMEVLQRILDVDNKFRQRNKDEYCFASKKFVIIVLTFGIIQIFLSGVLDFCSYVLFGSVNFLPLTILLIFGYGSQTVIIITEIIFLQIFCNIFKKIYEDFNNQNVNSVDTIKFLLKIFNDLRGICEDFNKILTTQKIISISISFYDVCIYCFFIYTFLNDGCPWFVLLQMTLNVCFFFVSIFSSVLHYDGCNEKVMKYFAL